MNTCHPERSEKRITRCEHKIMNEFFLAHKIHLTDSQGDIFERFLGVFMEYNAHTNLSAIRDKDGIILKHFIDSAVLLNYVPISGRLLDIGTGGGFPGIPLKILQENLEVTLLDSVGEKINACNFFIQTL